MFTGLETDQKTPVGVADENEVPVEAELPESPPQRLGVLMQVIFSLGQVALPEAGAVVGDDGRAGLPGEQRGQR